MMPHSDVEAEDTPMTATMPDTRLTGQMLIAGGPVRGAGKPIHAFDPTTGQTLEPAYHHGDLSHVDAACSAAVAAFQAYRATTSERRALFLEAIASGTAELVGRAITTPSPHPDSPPAPSPCSSDAAKTSASPSSPTPVSRPSASPDRVPAEQHSLPPRPPAPSQSRSTPR